jgi:hypothetical protein
LVALLFDTPPGDGTCCLFRMSFVPTDPATGSLLLRLSSTAHYYQSYFSFFPKSDQRSFLHTERIWTERPIPLRSAQVFKMSSRKRSPGPLECSLQKVSYFHSAFGLHFALALLLCSRSPSSRYTPNCITGAISEQVWFNHLLSLENSLVLSRRFTKIDYTFSPRNAMSRTLVNRYQKHAYILVSLHPLLASWVASSSSPGHHIPVYPGSSRALHCRWSASACSVALLL